MFETWLRTVFSLIAPGSTVTLAPSRSAAALMAAKRSLTIATGMPTIHDSMRLLGVTCTAPRASASSRAAVPAKVVIDEYVEICHAFFAADEPSFVNAVLDKHPPAGLWGGQTDEDELGFTYAQADLILYHLVDRRIALVLEIMRFSNELVNSDEYNFPKRTDVRPQELKMAKLLGKNPVDAFFVFFIEPVASRYGVGERRANARDIG